MNTTRTTTCRQIDVRLDVVEAGCSVCMRVGLRVTLNGQDRLC
ncbi:MAG: hypothetical protein KatS3mg105_1598 [Gemmatales bacterium]|nr:MAG: hypothetical protein KatS3mg105_1598 [Gemmatales bacterium]